MALQLLKNITRSFSRNPYKTGLPYCADCAEIKRPLHERSGLKREFDLLPFLEYTWMWPRDK
ncbi:hypothetical protein VCHA29O39_50171 [Vibrio chagasii]|nr:hypothetical protein VCHA34P121_10473 [Vibrio chagasii]CAH6862161.1 hypothetical protein VCHA28FP16_10812 [Vibrio chagasii]CAH6926383.1 hypothetical protein VCHA48P437_100128 [Vibrio chagasii]CAH6945587.1 hypothetical protein VCHA44O286_110128 [Vibrio chagasii]CAH6986009.1 hypothetical protein VCHA37O173_50134 [Vibrio chagasii]